MVRIAFIEDNNDDFNDLLSKLKEYYKNDINITRYFNGESFLNEYNNQFDFCIFDIELPGDNGMAIARKLRLIDEDVHLFFHH